MDSGALRPGDAGAAVPPGGAAPYGEQLLRHVKLAPLPTIRLHWRLLKQPRPPLARLAAVNLAGNIVLFIPLGYLLRAVFPKLRKAWQALLAAAGIIILVELFQMVTLLGACDVDDLILNLLGCAIGCGLYSLTISRNKGTSE